MSGLPFRPPPLPDEILGSWLERLALLNGNAAWHSLRRSAGYTSARKGYFSDIPDYSPELDALLTALGTTFEESLRRLTTLPYWLSFDGSSPGDGTLPGTTALPLICGRYGKPLRALRRLGGQSRAVVNPLRYCPACLSADLSSFGEPYWHRFHQLPLVSYCPEHLIALRSMCPRCGRAFFRDQDGRIPALRLTCFCQSTLSEDSIQIAPTPLQVRVTAVSLDALGNQCTTWDRHQMRAFLRRALAGKNPTRCLIDASDDGALVDSNTLIKDALRFMPQNASVDGMRGPACCALLAALGIEFKAAARAAPRITPAVATALSPLKVAPSVQRARETLSEMKNRSPERDPSKFGIHYWRVRVYDPGWLEQHFPSRKRRRLPSVTHDRAAIRHHLARLSATTPVNYALMLVRHSSAALRARVRDLAWLEQLSDDTRRGISVDKNRRRSERLNPPVSVDVADDKHLDWAHVPSLAQAKATLLHRKFEAPSRAPSIGSGISYWVVRLEDPDWLKKHFAQVRSLAVPSLRDDRVQIRRRLSGDSDTPRTHAPWALAWQSSAGQRARVRDQGWLWQQWSRHVQCHEMNQPRMRGPKKSPTRRLFEKEWTRSATRRSRLSALEAAIDHHDTGCRCTISGLAGRVGLSYWSIRYLFRTEPTLRDKVDLLSVKFRRSPLSQGKSGLRSTRASDRKSTH
ncbi:TniQ family protein [Paraburkholderia heleia]|uniref:TniQ family protein n=1 Tax=Paraburkholderia heleia TaxID=634127 RepID=UPI0038BD540C